MKITNACREIVHGDNAATGNKSLDSALVDELVQVIATAKAKWTAGNAATQEDINIHLAMPSNRHLAIEILNNFQKKTNQSDI